MRFPELLKRFDQPLVRHGFHRLATPRDRAAFAILYERIPFRYPRVFEALCLSYYWTEATVGEVDFAANPPGNDLSGLATSLRYDTVLWDHLLQRGYLIIGRMSGGRYDACAFDTNGRSNSDAPLVQIDHEEILSFHRLGKPTVLASSFTKFLEANLGATTTETMQ